MPALFHDRDFFPNLMFCTTQVIRKLRMWSLGDRFLSQLSHSIEFGVLSFDCLDCLQKRMTLLKRNATKAKRYDESAKQGLPREGIETKKGWG